MNVSSHFSYDQQAVLAELISRHVRTGRARSLLDIGAGPGTVAGQVAERVDRYVAIEEDEGRADSLVGLGLAVVRRHFPCAVPGEPFDLVVSSHSVPEGPASDYEPFVDAAWSLVAGGGTFLVATFKGPDPSPFHQWLAALEGRTAGPDPRYEILVRSLSSRTNLRFETVVSHIRTKALSDITAYFGSSLRRAGMIANERLDPEAEQAFAAHFLRGDTYEIPTPHTVIVAPKP